MSEESAYQILSTVLVSCIVLIALAVTASELYRSKISTKLKVGFKKLDECQFGSLVADFNAIVTKLRDRGETNSLRYAQALLGLAEATRRDGMLASAIIDENLVNKALEQFRSSAALHLELLGDTDVKTVEADYKLGRILRWTGNYKEARTVLESVVERSSNELKSNAQHELCTVYFELKEHELARQTAQCILDGYDEDHLFFAGFGGDMPVELILTSSLNSLGEHHEAEKILTELIEQHGKMLEAWKKDGYERRGKDTELLLLLASRAKTYLALGELEKARADYEVALHDAFESDHDKSSGKAICETDKAFDQSLVHWVESCAMGYLTHSVFDPAFDPYKWLLLQQTRTSEAQKKKNDPRLVSVIVQRTKFLLKIGQDELARQQVCTAVVIEEANGEFGVAQNLFVHLLLKDGEAERAKSESAKWLTRELAADPQTSKKSQ